MSNGITTILITGHPGVGKTTLVHKICEEITKTRNIRCRGFYTEEVRPSAGSGPRIGFDVVTLDGRRGVLAREGPNDTVRRPKVGKYSVYVNDFEALSLPLLATSSTGLLIIDEIGKMELLSKKFDLAVNALIGRVPLLATIPYQARQPLATVEKLKASPTSKIFEITKTNRNQIQREIINCITNITQTS